MAALVLASLAPRAGAAPRHLVIEGSDSLAATSSMAACWEMAETLETRGWHIPPMRVLVQGDPFDATRAGADLVLSSRQSPEDSAAEFVRAVVARQLAAAADPEVALLLADLVAARLAPIGASAPREWEAGWVQRLSTGDVLSTALPLALWRLGGDAAVRSAAAGPWPERAYEVLIAGQDGSLEEILGEIALAGLLDPALLGFGLPGAWAPALLLADGKGPSFPPGQGMLRVFPVTSSSGAAGVSAWRLHRTAAWLVVRYGFADGYDVVPLTSPEEFGVPLQGVAWSAVFAVSPHPDAAMSFNIRTLEGFPLALERWDFRSDEDGATIWWETSTHQGLQAFLVEAVRIGQAGGPVVHRRTVIPVAENGSVRRGYCYTDGDPSDVEFFRLVAMTNRGLLAEVGTFPVAVSDF